MKDKLGRIGLAIALALTLGASAACDPEDRADVREGVKDVEEGAEDAGKKIEEEVDQMDKDGKDD